MSTQQVYFINPNTVNAIATGTSNIKQGRPYGFKSQYITSVQPYVPDYEWEMRKSVAKVSRALTQFGSKEAFMGTTCNANHVSARVPTGWRASGGPVSTIVQPFKFTTSPSPFDTQGLPAPSLSGGISPTGGTQDLRDLDPSILNPFVLMSPVGCYMDECSASCLIKLNALTGAAGGAAVTSSINYILPSQQWFKDNGYTVAGAAAVQHIPIYLNDPRCNSVCHAHGVFEIISGYKKGLYPLTYIEQIFSNVDYIEFPGSIGAEVTPIGDVARIVAQNYSNFREECLRIGQAPLSNLSLSLTDSSASNTVLVPNWESKNFLISKSHGANIWNDNVMNLQIYLPLFLKMCGMYQTNLQRINDYFNITNIQTGPYTTIQRFMCPEAQTLLSSTGANAPFRQQSIYVYTGTSTGYLNYDGTFHSFLRAQQLDSWYRGNTGATGSAAYDYNLWGVADSQTQEAYIWYTTTGGLDFLGNTSSLTNAINTSKQVLSSLRFFTDKWSIPAVRNQMPNELFLFDALGAKGVGDDVLNWAMPGWDL